MFKENIESTIQKFTPQKNNEGGVDLVSEVRTILIESGLAKEVAENFDTNGYVRDAINIPFEGQRFLMNRYWNLQLLQLGLTSIEERFCLVDEGTMNDWIRLFKDKILPTLVSKRLPSKLSLI